jgi:prenyltransferase beta subunit
MKNIKRIVKNILYGPLLWLELLVIKTSRKSISDVIDLSTDYILSLRVESRPGFKFTVSSIERDLYSTIYCICYLGLVGKLESIPECERLEILNYIQSKQCNDGLYRDNKLATPASEDGQGWGWNHLLPHVLIALDYLNSKPKKTFKYIFDICDDDNWIENIFSGSDPLNASNKFMNICVALQYSRDFMNCKSSGAIIEKINKHAEQFLLDRYSINYHKMNVLDCSENVKIIYHLLPSILYDMKVDQRKAERIINMSIKTQNLWGGFGTSALSSACEDMDSVYNLSMLNHDAYRGTVASILIKFLVNIQVNQNTDGGFVYIKYKRFCYGGSKVLSSDSGQSNAFATWFRVLSIAFATTKVKKGISPNYWNFSNVSGYHWFSK